jgi:hypothetical protein
MKKLLFTFFIAAIGIGIFLIFKFDKVPSPAPEIRVENLSLLKIAPAGKTVSKGVASDVYAFKTKDNGVIQIGTERHSPPKPYLKMDKWDGEVSLKVQMPFETGDNPTVIGNKVRYSTADRPTAALQGETLQSYLLPVANAQTTAQPRIDIDIYPKPADEQNEDGGVEFDTILYEKPASNKIVFPIETNNLDFFYQPALNEENKDPDLTCTETECKDKDGNIINSRPENVVGSYAVYYKGGRSGDYSQMGGKNYRAGKAFHIYRPKVYDANNNSIWGELNVSTESGTLTISIDQNWLNTAVYPVTVDPMFGYSGNGGSSANVKSTYYSAYFGSSGTSEAAGTGDKISAYMKGSATDTDLRVKAELSDSSYSQIANSATNELNNINTSSFNWRDFSFSSSPTISASTNYVVWIMGECTGLGDNYLYLGYDGGGSSAGAYARKTTYGTWDNPIASVTVNDKLYSIYASYTASATPTPTPSPTPTPTPTLADVFKFNGLKMNGLNINH